MKKSKKTEVFCLEHPIEETLKKALAGMEHAPKSTKKVKTVAKNTKAKPAVLEISAENIVKADFMATLNRQQYMEIINEVIDPETGIGVVDMGLIFEVIETPAGLVDVKMTLTSMACPAGPQITKEVESALRLLGHVKEVKIEIVWEPPWRPEMMNEDVKIMLLGNNNFNMFGM